MTTTPSSQFHSQLLLLPVILLVILAATAQAQGQQPMARPGCPDKCGNISIPFPFGIGKPGCFRPGFQVVCNHSSDPPRAFLAGSRRFKGEAYSNDSQSYSDSSWSLLELVSISVATGEARVYAPIAYRCNTKNNKSFSTLQEMDFSDSPFAVSATRNVLIGVGLRAEAELTWAVDEFYGTSFTCRADDALFSLDVWNGTCTGWGCSERILPPDKGSGKSFSLSVNTMEKGWWWNETKPCGYGLLVDKSWYNLSKPDMEGDKTLLKRFPRGVPLVLDFVAGNTSCPAEGQPSPLYYACVSGNSSCANATYTTHPSYICKCWEGYDGNPYIAHGCQGRAKMSKPAKIGPWGGNGGSERDVQTKPTQLVSVTINSGDVIDAISFTYVGTDNVQYFSGKLGGTGGSEDKISLDPTNYVTEISGTIGKFQWNDVVTSLKIVTLKGDKTYGRVNGTPFRIPVLDGGKIAGFFGRSGDVLDAIGVYVTP